VPGEDLVWCHHRKDVLALVKNATLRNRDVTKLQVGSRHQLLFLSSMQLFLLHSLVCFRMLACDSLLAGLLAW